MINTIQNHINNINSHKNNINSHKNHLKSYKNHNQIIGNVVRFPRQMWSDLLGKCDPLSAGNVIRFPRESWFDFLWKCGPTGSINIRFRPQNHTPGWYNFTSWDLLSPVGISPLRVNSEIEQISPGGGFAPQRLWWALKELLVVWIGLPLHMN